MFVVPGDLFDPMSEVIAASAATFDANIALISKVWAAYTAVKLPAEEDTSAKALAEDRRRF